MWAPTRPDIYVAAYLAPAHIIVAGGEKSFQAESLTRGFAFIPFMPNLNVIEFYRVLEVPEGQYALFVARDRKPLREGQLIADP